MALQLPCRARQAVELRQARLSVWVGGPGAGWVGGWVGWVGWGGGQVLLDGFARHRELRATSSGGHGGAGSEAAEGGGGPGPCGPARRRWSTGAHEGAAPPGRGPGWGGGGGK